MLTTAMRAEVLRAEASQTEAKRLNESAKDREDSFWRFCVELTELQRKVIGSRQTDEQVDLLLILWEQVTPEARKIFLDQVAKPRQDRAS